MAPSETAAIITATRYHDLSFGHRVVGHESKCAMLHGHNYRIHFTCSAPELDSLGRVVDFSVIKSTLCAWIEEKWDHRFLAWVKDPVMTQVQQAIWGSSESSSSDDCDARKAAQSIVWVPFNPTAENLAEYLLRKAGPQLLVNLPLQLVAVRVEETRKCSAEASYL